MGLNADMYIQIQMSDSKLLQRDSNGGSFRDARRDPYGDRPLPPGPTLPVTRDTWKRESTSPATTRGTVLVHRNVERLTRATGCFIRIQDKLDV